MQPRPPQPAIPGRLATLASLAFALGTAHAAPFLYTPPDLILVFRQAGNASDLVANLGKVTRFTSVAAGTSIPVTAFTSAQLTSAFPSLNGIQWSVAAANRPPLDPSYPLQTLWVTAPRPDPATPATPWLRKGQFVQGNAGGQIDALGVNAALTSSLLPGGPNNTATAVVLPVSAAYAVGPVIGLDGNYAGTFQGRIESVTPDDFDSLPGAVSRADLFELLPGTTATGTLNQPGRFLGTFELKPDGSVTFVNPGTAPTAPTITGITRTAELTTVSFTTVTGAQYRLRRTDAAGLIAPVASWSVAGSIAGTGAIVSLPDTTNDQVHFYAVEALP